MKKVIFFAFILSFIWIGTASSFSAPIQSGIVNDVSNNFIVIDNKRYDISPTCKMFIQHYENNARHQRPGRISDIRQGDSLLFYTIANTVTELTIAR
jgi:hypothetical protein